METITCKNCHTTFEGRFCSHCGQKDYTEKDKSFKHLGDEILHFMTHLDGSFIRTVRTVLTKPGLLSLDYCNGKRKIYYKPISFFLLIVVLYLVFPMAKGMNQEMESYETNNVSGTMIHQQIVSKMEQKHIDKHILSEKFHSVSGKTSKILLLLLIPLSALFTFLLFFRQKKYAFDYFILATEFNSFLMLCFFILLPILVFPLIILFKVPDAELDYYIQPVLLVIALIYTSSLFRRFFKEKWIYTIPKVLLFLLFYGWIILPVYRFVIFEVTFMFV